MKFTAAILAVTASAAAAFAPAQVPRAAFALDAGIMDTLGTLEGPGQVWGAEGIDVGKEESDFKGSDNFDLFFSRLQSTGVASTLQGPGPFTVFAPTNPAIEAYETMTGPVDAAVCQYCIVQGGVPSNALSSAPLTTLTGASLTYGRRFRKDFVNDAIVGESTFGPFKDYPIDVGCDNGIIHGVGYVMEPSQA
jgi:uncharacterized surface protein with fasciclin (FAS1) repeats